MIFRYYIHMKIWLILSSIARYLCCKLSHSSCASLCFCEFFCILLFLEISSGYFWYVCLLFKIKRLNNAYGMSHGAKSWDKLLICDELGSSHS